MAKGRNKSRQKPIENVVESEEESGFEMSPPRRSKRIREKEDGNTSQPVRRSTRKSKSRRRNEQLNKSEEREPPARKESKPKSRGKKSKNRKAPEPEEKEEEKVEEEYEDKVIKPKVVPGSPMEDASIPPLAPTRQTRKRGVPVEKELPQEEVPDSKRPLIETKEEAPKQQKKKKLKRTSSTKLAGETEGEKLDTLMERLDHEPSSSTSGELSIFEFLLNLEGAPRAITRTLLVNEMTSLDRVMKTFIIAMGWSGAYESVLSLGEQSWTLSPWFQNGIYEALHNIRLQVENKMTFVYDRETRWTHSVVVKKIHKMTEESVTSDPRLKDALRCPIVIQARNACPPEDIGGMSHYNSFLKKLRSNELKEEQMQALDRYFGTNGLNRQKESQLLLVDPLNEEILQYFDTIGNSFFN